MITYENIFLENFLLLLYNMINNNIIDNDKGIKMFDINTLLKQAILETNNLNTGETFLVKDLFKGYEWNRIPRKNRLLLGTLFLSAVSTNKNLNVEIFEKTPSNQQKYKIK